MIIAPVWILIAFGAIFIVMATFTIYQIVLFVQALIGDRRERRRAAKPVDPPDGD